MHGFTLIELAIVVAIVATLAALALPMYAEQARSGQRTEAMRTLRELTLQQERWRAAHPAHATLEQLVGNAAAFNQALKHYTVSVADVSARTYTMKAIRRHTRDPTCGDFIVALDAGVVAERTSIGDARRCWRR